MLTATLRETLTDRNGVPFVARDYEAVDLPALVSMYADFEPKRAAQGLPPLGDARIRAWLTPVLAHGRHILVESEGRLCGHSMLIPRNNDSIELANFLHQSIRGRGLGTAMNMLALRLAREAGAARVWLSVEPGNRAAVRSYEKVGFRRLPGSLWAPEIEMELGLASAG